MQKLEAAEAELARLRGDLQAPLLCALRTCLFCEAARKDEAMRQQEWMATAQVGRPPEAQKSGRVGRRA